MTSNKTHEQVVLAVVVEHVLLLLKTVVFGAIDRVPVLVRNAQSTVAIKQKEERMDFRKRAAGLPVRYRTSPSVVMKDIHLFSVESFCSRVSGDLIFLLTEKIFEATLARRYHVDNGGSTWM